MITNGIKLDMYLAPPSEAVFAALGASLRAVLTEAGIDPSAPFGAGFAVGQVCGITYATAPAGQMRYLATMVADDPAVPAGHYNSLLITPRAGGLATPADFDPARHRAVINEAGSFSGSLTFTAHMASAHNRGIGTALLSGAHLDSVVMVARGEAELAAIDRISFALARRTVPDEVAGVTVIGETRPYPGIPFVADAGLPDDVVSRLRDAILGFRDNPAWPDMKAVLGISDIIILDEDLYPPMARVAT